MRSPEPSESGAGPVERPTILVVDDNPDALDLVTLGLSSRGFLVRAAHGGRAGLREALADPPDLVLLDASMPDLSGFEVLARLRATPATADLPIFILTASGRDPILIERGLASGADDYLVKPLRIDELAVRIEGFLRRRARLQGSKEAALDAIDTARRELRGVQDALDALYEAKPLDPAQFAAYTQATTRLEVLQRILLTGSAEPPGDLRAAPGGARPTTS